VERIIVAANRIGDWKADGATSMAAWLTYRYNLASATAHQWVTVATSLEELPALRAAYIAGAVSFEQLRYAVTFATPVDDTQLADLLPGLNVAQVRAMAAARRPLPDDDAAEAHLRRSLRLRPDRSGHGSRMSGFLPTEQAAVVEQALSRRAEAMPPDPESGLRHPYDSRCADALVELCAEDLAEVADASSSPDASVVVIHVQDDVVDGVREGNGMVDGEPITATAVQRLLCDTKIEFHIDNEHGQTVGIGRKSKTPPRWLRRRVLHRDGGCCRWPGCCRPVRHIHHIRHWTRGGPTDATNLIGLCWFHHHLVHEGRWNATGNADSQITFTGPNGHTLHSRAGPPLAA
jgi:hypothetical protein